MADIIQKLEGGEVDRAFALYETTGSIKEVSRIMEVPYAAVREALYRDPIRKHDVEAVRAEQVARRWEAVDESSSALCMKLLRMIHAMVDHVQSHADAGVELTDLIHPKDKGGKVRLSPMQAIQYLFEARVLEQAQKTGLSSAKIAEGFRQIASAEGGPGIKNLREQASLTPAQIEQTISELQAAGLPLPPGLSQWQASRG